VNRLRAARESRGFSQKELAEAAGITATTISRYETGKRKLTVETAQQLAVVLDMDWVCLFEPPDTKASIDHGEGGQR
jgi:transcriptional regulator with XRE-family HTH domain